MRASAHPPVALLLGTGTQGAECCRLRVGVEQWRKEADESFTRLDPTLHDMVAFESTARETYAR